MSWHKHRPGGRLLCAIMCGLALSAIVFVVSAQPQGSAVRAIVIRLIDCDTIEVRIGDKIERVRYIGINTPEIHHPIRGPELCSEAAKTVKAELVVEKNVLLVFDTQQRDRDGRLLAYVYVGDQFINAELVRAGYAEVVTFPPNVRHREEFVSLQREARLAKRGLWSDPDAVQHHRPRSSGVYGNTRLKVYFHPDDGARGVLLVDTFVYFESPEEATAAGYKPSMDYTTFAQREQRFLSGGPLPTYSGGTSLSAADGWSFGSYGFASGTYGGAPGYDVHVRGYYRGGTYVAP